MRRFADTLCVIGGVLVVLGVLAGFIALWATGDHAARWAGTSVFAVGVGSISFLVGIGAGLYD